MSVINDTNQGLQCIRDKPCSGSLPGSQNAWYGSYSRTLCGIGAKIILKGM